MELRLELLRSAMVDPDLWVLFHVLVALFIPSARVDSDGNAEATSRRLSLRAVHQNNQILFLELAGLDWIENKNYFCTGRNKPQPGPGAMPFPRR